MQSLVVKPYQRHICMVVYYAQVQGRYDNKVSQVSYVVVSHTSYLFYLPQYLSTPRSLDHTSRYVRLYIRLRYGMVDGMVLYHTIPIVPTPSQVASQPAHWRAGTTIRDCRPRGSGHSSIPPLFVRPKKSVYRTYYIILSCEQ